MELSSPLITVPSTPIITVLSVPMITLLGYLRGLYVGLYLHLSWVTRYPEAPSRSNHRSGAQGLRVYMV